MANLTEYNKKLTYRDKLEIIVAWELMYGQRYSVGLVPFLDKSKVESALLRRLAEGPNFDGIGGVLKKLGARVTSINAENETTEVTTANGYRQSVVTGRSVTVKVERYNEEGVLDVQTLVYTNP